MGPGFQVGGQVDLTEVTEIKGDGDKVIFTLGAGNADFPFVASDDHTPIMPAEDGKADWQSGVGGVLLAELIPASAPRWA